MHNNIASIPVVVIAGGQSQRLSLNASYKWQLPFGSGSLLAFILSRLNETNSAIAVNLPADERLSQCVLPIIYDDGTIPQCPLSGLHTALQWAEQEGYAQVATLPCDTPFFPDSWLRQLAYKQSNLAIVASYQKRWHPLIGLWPTSLLTPLIAHQGQSMMSFCQQWATCCEFAEQDYDPFFNINTPLDYEQALIMRKTLWPS